MTHTLARPDGSIVAEIPHLLAPNLIIEPWEKGEVWSGVQEIGIRLAGQHWYGQGALGHQQYPLEKIAQYPAPFLTSDNGATGLLTILHPLWITSGGLGVEVEADEMTVSFNAPLSGQAHEHSFVKPAPLNERPLLAEGHNTEGLLKISGRDLRLRFYLLETPRQVTEAFWARLTLPEEAPPEQYFRQTLWTTWANLKNHISHSKIFELAEKISDYQFNGGLLGIDAKWQDEFGSTRFDPVKFPNPKNLIAALHRQGFHVTLWCVPFYMPQSQHFDSAIQQGYVLEKAGGEPLIADWWEGQAAFLDPSYPAALQWHLDNLQALADEVDLDGFKFDAGEGMFYAKKDVQLDLSPNLANQAYVRAAARRFPWSDTRSAWRNQSEPMLFRQWDKSSWWGYDNGLASCITQAITLNLLGYPYSFPDMIGGNKYGEQQVTAELLIRWTQAVAPMPIIQFSLPPWEYGEDCAQLCARYARLHGELSRYTLPLAKAKTLIVRPLWWLDPGDETALTCADQYLIGDELLVAPVIHEGARARDIYFPVGQWRSYWNPEEIHGPGWVRDYPAPLDSLPLFVRSGQ
jgi:alpha-glucosidase (family GH31 glycosyl hydrolase)